MSLIRSFVSFAFITSLLLNGCKDKKAAEVVAGKAESAPGQASAAGRPPVLEAPQAVDGAAKLCAGCHAEQFRSWSSSQHAQALRRVNAAQDDAAFVPAQTLEHQSFTSTMSKKEGRFQLDTQHKDGRQWAAEGKLVIGVTPLVQYLAPFSGGRLQAVGMAFDPLKVEWFDVYEGQDRQPEEWGHWLNRGMCSNGQCLECHTTGYTKGYDAVTDSFDTRAEALGISCSRCHGELEAHLKNPAVKTQPAKGDWAQSTQTCGSCHSRRELLVPEPKPGQAYFDVHRPVLADAPGVYHPDGQILDEDFEYGSFLMSRMHAAGVQCLHCHDPHSGKTRLPAKDNTLCLQCHGPVPQMGATSIDPLRHSGHAAGSAGNLCVNCHMPETTYMVRDPRRDHGFICPDPQLSKDLGVPNACNRCHTDKGVDWALELVKKRPGYTASKRIHDRRRAAAVQAGRDYAPGMVAPLLELLKSETVPAWRAVILALLSPAADQEPVRKVLREALRDADPQVRAAGVRGLAGQSSCREALRPLLQDKVRLVRLAAGWALLDELPADAPLREELRTQISCSNDQPPGALREADYHRQLGDLTQARHWMQRAAGWDNSAGAYEQLAHFHYSLQEYPQAAEAFRKAIAKEPGNAQLHMSLALVLVEAGDRPGALAPFREAAALAPRDARVRYNLGVLLLQLGRRQEAAAILTESLRLQDSPDTRQALQMALQPQVQPAP